MTTRSKADTRAWWLLVGLLTAILCAPLFLADIPPVLDYPNHLARAYLLAFGQSDPILSRMVAPRWAMIPNLAIDLILPPLLHLAPVHIAGRLALADALLLPLAGVLAYNRALFGERVWWPCAVALVGFNGAVLFGFINFLYAVGAGLLTAAAWRRWRETRPLTAILITSAGAIVVFFCHFTGLILLATLIGADELDRLLASGLRSPVIRRALAAAIPFVVPAVLYLASPTAQATGGIEWITWVAKLVFAIGPVMNYNLAKDTGTAAVLLIAVGLALRHGWITMPRSTVIALSALVIAFLLAPYRLNGGALVDYRFIIMAGYVVFAGSRETRPPPAAPTIILIGAILLLFIAHTGLLASIWMEQNHDITDLRATIAPVPPGARVLITTVDPPDARTYWATAPRVRIIDGISVADLHLPVILLIERRALPQTLFADRTQQPIRVLPAYANSSAAESAWGVPNEKLLMNASAEQRTRFPYLTDWRANFDFVLVMNAGGLSPADTPGRLAPVTATDIAALFRIEKESE